MVALPSFSSRPASSTSPSPASFLSSPSFLSLPRHIDRQAIIKFSVFVFGKVCLVGAVWFVLATGDRFRELKKFTLPQLPEAVSNDGLRKRDKRDITQFATITARNIFGREDTKAQNTPTAQVAELKLRLVGTNIGGGPSGTAPFAIFEDSKGAEQDLFELNELVFNQAKLVEILPEQVRLEYNGKLVTLVLDDAPSSGDESGGEDDGDKTEYSVPEAEISDALANLPRLLSEARAVPYFRNGQSIGMRLFAIRRGSLYEKLGLKNGDIIQMVNDTSVADPSQALKLFEQLKSERSIGVKLERNGELKSFNYSVK